MKKSLFLLFVICFFFACSGDKKKQVPSVFLTEPQMVDVLTDVQIMEAMISYKKNVNQKTAYLKTVGYDTVFAHHGITDSIFRENMSYYYSVEPQTLIKIMDSVESRLSRMRN